MAAKSQGLDINVHDDRMMRQKNNPNHQAPLHGSTPLSSPSSTAVHQDHGFSRTSGLAHEKANAGLADQRGTVQHHHNDTVGNRGFKGWFLRTFCCRSLEE